MALEPAASPRINSDLDFNFEAGLATMVDEVSIKPGCGLMLSFQCRLLLCVPYRHEGGKTLSQDPFQANPFHFFCWLSRMMVEVSIISLDSPGGKPMAEFTLRVNGGEKKINVSPETPWL